MTDARTNPVMLISDSVWARRRDDILTVAPNVEPVIYVGDDPIDAAVTSTIDLAFYSSDLWPERSRGIAISILNAANLQWLHSFSAGVDNPFFTGLMDRGVRVTNSSGATASPIAQTAILYMLALSRNVRAWIDHQSRHEWTRHTFNELDGSRLAVIGMGPIGEEIARLGVALNMTVEGIRRTPTGHEPCPTFAFASMMDVIARADWVAVALPLTDETRGIFDAAAFARMKPGAHFINVGRGELVDEDALVNSLRTKHLAGAGLDVFNVEPLPTESPLWDMPNVIITPHSSGASPTSAVRAEDIFIDNLGRWCSGEPLRNDVTR
jgi:D-2-hydroxyacid dehydrogenase (NADP+)